MERINSIIKTKQKVSKIIDAYSVKDCSIN